MSTLPSPCFTNLTNQENWKSTVNFFLEINIMQMQLFLRQVITYVYYERSISWSIFEDSQNNAFKNPWFQKFEDVLSCNYLSLKRNQTRSLIFEVTW